MFRPKSFFFPEYHKSISLPFRLTVFSRHRLLPVIQGERGGVIAGERG